MTVVDPAPPVTGSRRLRVTRTCALHAFAGCQDASCAPPPVGTGGSLPGGGAGVGKRLRDWYDASDLYDLEATAEDRRYEMMDSGDPVEVAIAMSVELWSGSYEGVDRLREHLNNDDPNSELFRQAILDSPPTDRELFRGLNGVQEPEAWLALKVGDTIDNSQIGAFTGNAEHADGFGSIILTMKPGAAAMPIAAISNTSAEDEWLVAGSVRVTKIEPGTPGRAARTFPDADFGPALNIEVEYIGATGEPDTIGLEVDFADSPSWHLDVIAKLIGVPLHLQATGRSTELACHLHQFRGCQDASCAPPPAGTGGSLPGGGAGRVVKYGTTLGEMLETMLALDDGEDMGEAMMDYQQSVEEHVGMMLHDAYGSAVPDDWTVHVSFSMDTDGHGGWMVDIESDDVAPVVSMRRSVSYREGVDGDGAEWIVHHDQMNVHPDFQGKGYGQAITDAAEGVYRQLGVDAIELTAADVGRYAWAAAGYDWSIRTSMGEEAVAKRPRWMQQRSLIHRLDQAAQHILNGSASEEQQERVTDEIDSLRRRVEEGDIPIPYEFATIGRREWSDADGVWPGKHSMLNSRVWNGRKEL